MLMESVEHWNVASNHGRAVAHTITNPDSANAFDKIPIFWSSAGGGLRYCGNGAGYDDLHIDGDVSKELKVRLSFLIFVRANTSVRRILC
jgi:hypothetical protein